MVVNTHDSMPKTVAWISASGFGGLDERGQTLIEWPARHLHGMTPASENGPLCRKVAPQHIAPGIKRDGVSAGYDQLRERSRG